MKTKVLIVDDHPLILDGIASIISEHASLEIVGHATNGKTALEFIQTCAVDLVMTDLDMPEMSGLELIQAIRSKQLALKILVLTMHNEKSTIRQIMDAGGDGFLLKTANRDEMLQAVDAIIAGKKFFSPEVTVKLLTEEVHDDVPDFDLTEREIEIVQLIAEGFSNKEIGEKLFISHRTVDTHRTNVMKKLNVNNIASLVRFALTNGIVQ